ncbi:MAG: glutamate mutase L [Bacillota bacterium]
MNCDLVIAEIGSTTTVVSGLNLDGKAATLLGQGVATTTARAGDVTVGLGRALDDLAARLGAERLTWGELRAASSAAGGLRMSVHGLVYDMTVKAAREAALGAGAVLVHVTAGDLGEADVAEVARLNPRVILLAGGVDYGEQATVIANAHRLANLPGKPPVVYAGNVAALPAVRAAFTAAGCEVHPAENVYPRLDELNIEPTRKAIQQVFEIHIVQAPGMERLRELVTGRILPVPGAVMEAAKLLYGDIGDLVVFDVGGATTDVHSITEGDEELTRLLVSPEPLAKRTVEGDLGVYLNAPNLEQSLGPQRLAAALGVEPDELPELRAPIPTGPYQVAYAAALTKEAVRVSLSRHAGRLKHLVGPTGRATIAEGKDLSLVKHVIGTGGALTRLPGGADILAGACGGARGRELFPPAGACVHLDGDYIMACAGMLAGDLPEAALSLLKTSLRLQTGGEPR